MNTFDLKSPAQIGAVVGLMMCSVSCQSIDQGYWTKQNVSQAIVNEQYPDDSRQCDRQVAQSGSKLSEANKSKLYGKCMQARGYHWIEEELRSHPVKSAKNSATQGQTCPAGRLIVDAFGYQRCVPAGEKSRGMTIDPIETVAQAVEKPASQNRELRPTKPLEQKSKEWIKEDGVCRQYARDTLSSPYGVYVQCMQGKGWPSGTP